MGADHVLNRNNGDYWASLAELTNNRGVDVVIENTGAATWANSLKSLVKGGRLVTYGRTTGSIAETDIRLIFWHHLHIIGSTMANRKEFVQVMQLIFKGKLKPVVDSVYPLHQAARAYQHLLDGKQFGKVVINMEAE
jgi:NADPH:quinone reductase-like Zn-dependent oxidoreductase